MSGDINVREVVLDLLLEKNKNSIPSHLLLNDTLRKYQYLDKKDRSFITKVSEGVIENQIRLDYVINQFSKTDTTKMKPLIRILLQMGTYEALFMDTKAFAISNEHVKLAKKRGFTNLAGFINGVLRSIIRDKANINYPDKVKDLKNYLSIMYSMPKWIVGQVIKQYGEKAEQIIVGMTTPIKETSVRINSNKIDKKEAISRLQKEGISARESGLYNNGIYITDYDYLDRISLFKEGLITPQDVSSMLVSYVALPIDDNRNSIPDSNTYVIDMCAAPGGKAIHMAEILGDRGVVDARDVSETKTSIIMQNIERTGVNNILVKVFDATIFDETVESKADVVICDVPCSGLGVTAKKSDIRYNITYDSQKELVILQRNILENAVKYVKANGTLIFSTCTINKEENYDNYRYIIDELGMEKVDISNYFETGFHENETKEGYLSLLPGIDGTDGFFISKFRKK